MEGRLWSTQVSRPAGEALFAQKIARDAINARPVTPRHVLFMRPGPRN